MRMPTPLRFHRKSINGFELTANNTEKSLHILLSLPQPRRRRPMQLHMHAEHYSKLVDRILLYFISFHLRSKKQRFDSILLQFSTGSSKWKCICFVCSSLQILTSSPFFSSSIWFVRILYRIDYSPTDWERRDQTGEREYVCTLESLCIYFFDDFFPSLLSPPSPFFLLHHSLCRLICAHVWTWCTRVHNACTSISTCERVCF